jgi:hypothetical protein
VVHAMPPAARGQFCLFAAIHSRRKRTEAEDQDQKNGEAAPHLPLMVHEVSRTALGRAARRVSSLYRVIWISRAKLFKFQL